MRLAWTPICIVVVFIAVTGSGCELRTGSEDAVVVRPVSGAGPTTYFVDSARGSDSNPGTSPKAPWRSLSAIDRIGFRGGDSVLLRGGQHFSGTIRLGSGNLGATLRTAMLRIGSYGERRATIVAPPGQDAISAIDVSGIHISALNLTGQTPTCRRDPSNGYRHGAAGIRVEAADPDTALERGISIDHVDVSGFCNGIAIGSTGEDSRISHLRVTAVSAHDNASAGIWTFDRADRRHAIRDVRVSGSRAYRNGVRGGIVLFGVDGGTVERSVAFANGRAAGGGVGIWAFDSTRIRFAHNESYANGRPGIHDDGDGFDFDRGVSDSVMVDNYSHDNGGVGFLVCSCNGKYYPYYRIHDVVLRSNVSRNDGSSGQPSLWIEGGEPMTGVQITSNRVESAAGDGPLVKITGSAHTAVLLNGNAFAAWAPKALRVADLGPSADLVLRDNTWRAMPAP